MEWMRLFQTARNFFSNGPRTKQLARPASASDSGGYLGDWTGALPTTRYAPNPNGRPDAGEVVWAWVPYEEDHSQGKDRPVLLIASHPTTPDVFLALPLTSKDHDRDAAQEQRAGRLWMDVGSGPWDLSGRPSEVRLNRVLTLRESDIRREGAAMDEKAFTRVLDAAQEAVA